MSDNLPIAASRGDVALVGEASGAGIAGALENLVANLHRSGQYDDINIALHSEQHADGSSRSVFSYRAYKHRR